MKWTWTLAAVICVLALAGCKTANGAKSPVATAVFRGNTPGQIFKVLDEAFGSHGYQAKQTTLTTMVFEKKGSVGDNIMYGNWNGNSPVWIRVKGTLVPVGEATFRLDCSATRVRDPGSSVEEEVGKGKFGRKSFQSILNEAVLKLSGGQAAR